jgi:thiol:disulfide interchange protein DsbA
MQSTRRRLVLASALLPALPAVQAQPKAPVAGKEYRRVDRAQPVDTGAKIEVIEFFWYGCPACARLHPELAAWKKKMPADVEYRRVPVAFNPAATNHSKLYYALESLKRTDDLQAKVFAAIHGNRKQLLDPNDIADFMAANGIDRKAWLDAFNSFTVATQANRAPKIWSAYKLDATPSVAVDGKFMTSPAMAGSWTATTAVMDHLIDLARKERAKK